MVKVCLFIPSLTLLLRSFQNLPLVLSFPANNLISQSSMMWFQNLDSRKKKFAIHLLCFRIANISSCRFFHLIIFCYLQWFKRKDCWEFSRRNSFSPGYMSNHQKRIKNSPWKKTKNILTKQENTAETKKHQQVLVDFTSIWMHYHMTLVFGCRCIRIADWRVSEFKK